MYRVLVGFVAGWLCFTIPVWAASPSFDVIVSAGPHERNNVPVRVRLPLGEIGGQKAVSVVLTGPDGKVIPTQWTKPGLRSGGGGELHFVVAHVPANESLHLKAVLSP